MKLKSVKHLLCMILIILLLSGCSLVYIEKQSIDEIIDTTLGENTKLRSVSLEGYSYFLPQGVNAKSYRGSNSVLYYNHRKMYLYVDLVSYYHKVKNTYQTNFNSYYSKKIDINKKTGYLEINELEGEYFIEFVFNYSKMEAYVKKENLNKTLTIMAYILRSVDFNDSIIESLIGEKTLNYQEETFNIFKSNGSDSGEFLDIAEEYDEGRINSKNEDTLEIEENIE